MWFAWKIVPLRYTKQPLYVILCHCCSCDLLEKSYLCGIQNNLSCADWLDLPVVICLKNRTFAVYKTTVTYLSRWNPSCDLLEKSYLCGIQNNRTLKVYIPTISCDLLEKSYLCGIQNNNDFTNRYSVMLWFAWKIVPLRYTKQPALTLK